MNMPQVPLINVTVFFTEVYCPLATGDPTYLDVSAQEGAQPQPYLRLRSQKLTYCILLDRELSSILA